MRSSLAIAIIFLAPATGQQQEQDLKQAILRCATVDGTSNRLDCYDALADSVADPRQVASPDRWSVKVGKDAIDDTTTVSLTLLGTKYQAELLLGCKQGKTQVLLGLRGQFVGASDPVVWTRLGAAKAEKKRWSVSSNGKAVVLPGDAGAFIRQLLSTDRLTVQMELSARGPVTDVFQMQGLKDSIQPLNDACALK